MNDLIILEGTMISLPSIGRADDMTYMTAGDLTWRRPDGADETRRNRAVGRHRRIVVNVMLKIVGDDHRRVAKHGVMCNDNVG